MKKYFLWSLKLSTILFRNKLSTLANKVQKCTQIVHFIQEQRFFVLENFQDFSSCLGALIFDLSSGIDSPSTNTPPLRVEPLSYRLRNSVAW